MRGSRAYRLRTFVASYVQRMPSINGEYVYACRLFTFDLAFELIALSPIDFRDISNAHL